MIIDSHAHYAHFRFNGEYPYLCDKNGEWAEGRADRKHLLCELRKNGIVGSIEPSIEFDSIEDQLALVSEHKESMWAALGVHPTRCINTPWKNRKKLQPSKILPLLIATICGIIPGALLLRVSLPWVLKTILGIVVILLGVALLDILSEERVCTEQEVIDIQSRKTGCLINAACVLGVIAGGGSEDHHVPIERVTRLRVLLRLGGQRFGLGRRHHIVRGLPAVELRHVH